MKFSLAHSEQSLGQFFERSAHSARMHVGEKDSGHDAPQAQPTHCASSRDRLVTCGYGFARDHFLTEAYQFINLGGELLADLIFFLIPGTLGSKGRAQPRGIAGVQPPDLLEQGTLLGRVYKDS